MFLEGNKQYPCKFGFQNSGTRYILGFMFMKDFYTIYDLESFKVGLGKTAVFVVDESDPAGPVDEVVDVAGDKSSEGAFILVFSLLIAATCAVGCCFIRSKKAEDEAEDPNASLNEAAAPLARASFGS